MKILIMGLGFVGLTTALGFADKGIEVYGYDVNENQSLTIKSGEVPFLENGLTEALQRNLNKKFWLVDDIEYMDFKVDAVFFCVGTPCDELGKAELKFLKIGIESVIGKVEEKCLLVVKSTIPPGTTQKEVIPYIRSMGYQNPVAANPEFLREGYCWKDFTQPDRIVCGIEEECSRECLNALYKDFGAPIHFVTTSTAEFIKYLSNSLLANLISFSNEMAMIADAAGDISIGEAFKILHEDNRLNGAGISHYIYPGCGYGGYCLPKDTVALFQNARENGIEPNLLKQVIQTNEQMPKNTAKKIIARLKGKLDNVGILGLSFKPNSDDVRYSPAEKIIAELINLGYSNIYAYDPAANENFALKYRWPIHYCTSKEEVCKKCPTVAIVTTWDEFKEIDKMYPNVNWVDCRYFL